MTTDNLLPTADHGRSPRDVRVLGAPVEPRRAVLRGARAGEVRWDPAGFWGARQQVNAEATFAHCVWWMDHLGWLENFDRVARGDVTTERAGWQFSDSEVYKLLEAMAWELGRTAPDGLRETYDSLVARIAAAQDDDGYLGTAFGHPGLPERYSDMSMGHELYNMGHLLQAAVARLRTGGDDLLVETARRAADHVCNEFGEHGRDAICGHPEIEVALVEFGRATGQQRYIDQARLFVERRGRGSLAVRPLLSADYFQDDIPVRKASVLRGHAVRALYLSAGAVDVAVESDDELLLAALTRQWERTVERRTYITGGMGSRHQDEGFGDDWELPPDRAYCETCAGVASVMFSWRLFLATGDVRYADLIERTLFNVVATGQRSDGRAFFYANPLHLRAAPPERSSQGLNMRAEGGQRAAWFDVSCCPTNVARTLASLESYACAVERDVISLLQYGAGTISIDMDGNPVELRIDTEYPHDGVIAVTVAEAPPRLLTVRLRIPHWAVEATGAAPGDDPMPIGTGWWDVSRIFAAGDRIELRLPLEPRFSWPDSRIDAVRGTVAVERGPLVLCVEEADVGNGTRLERLVVDADTPPEVHADGALVRAGFVDEPDESDGRVPFGEPTPSVPDTVDTIGAPLVPYYRWAEREPGTMRVFLPVAGGDVLRSMSIT